VTALQVKVGECDLRSNIASLDRLPQFGRIIPSRGVACPRSWDGRTETGFLGWSAIYSFGAVVRNVVRRMILGR